MLTFDSDFGSLAFFHDVQAPVGIVFLRFHPVILDEIFEATERALNEFPDNHFAVVTREGCRLRPMPRRRVDER